jgi:hypothetical protein
MRIAKGYTSVRKLADLLGVSFDSLKSLAKAGKMPLAEGHGLALVVSQKKLRLMLVPNLPETAASTVPAGYLTVVAAAKQLGMTPASVYMAISKGLIKTTLYGGVKYIPDAALRAYAEYRKVQGEAASLRQQLAQLTKKQTELKQAQNGASIH